MVFRGQCEIKLPVIKVVSVIFFISPTTRLVYATIWTRSSFSNFVLLVTWLYFKIFRNDLYYDYQLIWMICISNSVSRVWISSLPLGATCKILKHITSIPIKWLLLLSNSGEPKHLKVFAYWENGELMATIRTRNETYYVEVSMDMF